MKSLASEFSERLEAFVEKYGLPKANNMIRSLTDQKKSIYTTTKHRFMGNFLQLEAAKTFDITLEEYNSNRIKQAREARWAVVHLLRNYTQLSYEKVAKMLKLKYRASRYAYEKCGELIEVGKFEKVFNERYAELEEKLVAFIAKI